MDDSRARGEDAFARADLREMERRVYLRNARLKDDRRRQLLHALHAGGKLRRSVGGTIRLAHAPRRKTQRPRALLAGSERAGAGRKSLRAHLVASRASQDIVGKFLREANLARFARRVLNLDPLIRRRLVNGREHGVDDAQRTVGGVRFGAPHAVERNRVHDLAARLSVRRQMRHLLFGELVRERAVRVVRLHTVGGPHDLAS